MKVLVFVWAVVTILSIPHRASAGFFSFLGIGSANAATQTVPIAVNSQTMSLLEANVAHAEEAPNLPISTDGTTLTPQTTLSGGAVSDQSNFTGGSDQISVYKVHGGDTLKSIAKLFDVSESTILWANDLSPKDKLVKDQVLTILPIDGVLYTIKKGDTFGSIAKKLGSTIGDIAEYNDLALTDSLNVGDTIIIPNGEIATTPTKSTPIKNIADDNTTPNKPIPGNLPRELTSQQGPYYPDYYIRPLKAGIRTQGAHGKNGVAVDIAAPTGTPILAAADGTVIIAKTTGYNSGYAEYVVIAHANHTQTLYAHMSKVLVSVGDTVNQGQTIGLVGMTGNATGPHVHYEVRGAVNPMTLDKNYGL